MSVIESVFGPAASSVAESGRPVTIALVSLATLFTVGVYGTIGYFIWKYRKGRPANRLNPPSTSVMVEAIWIAVTFSLAMTMFGWTSYLYFAYLTAPKDSYKVYVMGKQWMWKTFHLSGKGEINQVHLPRGKPAVIFLSSQDVVHGFFVPDFRVKMDVVPGKFTRAAFTPFRTGRFYIFCTQYCGAEHALMRGEVIVMEPQDFDVWLREEGESGPIPPSALVAGEQIFNRLGCGSCHTPFGDQLGPRLRGLFARGSELLADGRLVPVDDNYVRRAILQPDADLVNGYKALMPAYAGQATEEQLVQLMVYLRSLS